MIRRTPENGAKKKEKRKKKKKEKRKRKKKKGKKQTWIDVRSTNK